MLFLPPIAGLAVLFLWINHTSTQRDFSDLALRENAAVEKAVISITRDLHGVAADLLVLAELPALKILAASGAAAERAKVTGHFLTFSDKKRVFSQVRYLDLSGQEVVRVNLTGDKPRAVPASQLQNKRDRYYFQDTLALAPGSVYVSRFDLNIENGRIETPWNPMLRFATPVTDRAGRKRGVLVLNYNGGELIANAERSMAGSTGHLLLIDHAGYWLVAPDPGMAWGFMYPGGPRFAERHPPTWERMLAADAGTLREPAGLYYYATIYPMREVASARGGRPAIQATGPRSLSGTAQFWKVASFIDSGVAPGAAYQRSRNIAALYAAIACTWLVISLLLAHMRVSTQRSRALADRLSSVIEQTSDVVFITDAAGRIEYANPSFEQVTGYDRAGVVGRSPGFLRSGTHPQEFYRDLWSTVLGGRSFQSVFTNRTRDGALYYEQKTISPLKDRQGRVTHLASTGKDITAHMLVQEKLAHQAYHNPLTDLPNRTLFRDRLVTATTHARRSGRLIALLFVDLDHFKNVNDSLGHHMGDQLLIQVAARLRDCVRESDTVAHVGGDEFAIILDGLENVDQVTAISNKILQLFGQEFRLGNTQVFLGISIGIVLYPLDDVGIDDLIKDADTALYHAKAQGRNRYEFYTADMTERVRRRLALETELRQALEQEEFVVHYQPVVNVASGEITGCEALLRWNHPQRGLVAPGEFISVLEDSGMIVPVTRWLLRQASIAGGILRAATGRDLRIAVNVSARSFHVHHDAMDLVAGVLENGPAAPGSVVFEITESVLLESGGTVEPTLKRLRELGVRVAIDDFGTGYSSLRYLRRFPIDVIKIDREFIRHSPDSRDDTALVTAIIGMARGLGIEVVAEGVETRAQLDFLRKLGCDSVQGFLYSPAVPPEALAALITGGLRDKPAADAGG